MAESRTYRIVRVPVYWIVVGVMVMLVSPVLSIVASTRIADHRARTQLELSKAKSCSFYTSVLAQYDKIDRPLSETQVAFRTAYVDLYNDRGCQPPRK